MSEELHSSDNPAVYTARILSGMMFGAEFELPAGRIRFVVGGEPAFDSHDEEVETLYLPGDATPQTIELELPDPAGALADQFVFRLAAAQESIEESGVLNRPMRAGDLHFAVRRLEEGWSPAVLDIQQPPARRREVEPVLPSLELPQPKRRSYLNWVLGGVLVVGVLAGIGRMVWLSSHVDGDQQVRAVSQMIQGAAHPCLVRMTADHQVYVLTATEADADWVRQALTRAGKLEGVTVASRSDEVRRIGHLLDERNLAWFALRMDDPLHPVLLISKDRAAVDAASLLQWKSWLKVRMPYAESVAVEVHGDEELMSIARSGLTRLAIPFDEVRHEGSLTFVTRGDLDDVTLAHLQRFSDQFYQQWGARFVHFSVELHEDWLKGKSYQYGSNGYVKMSPQNWYFPAPLTSR